MTPLIVVEPTTEAYVLRTVQFDESVCGTVERAYGPGTYEGLENFARLLDEHDRETSGRPLGYMILALEAPEL